VSEPSGLTIQRHYEIQWKKQTLNGAELASLRFEKGLGPVELSKRFGVTRTAITMAINRFEGEQCNGTRKDDF
jgi:hypothetical protein